MATYSSILVWGIAWTEKPGRLPSIGSQRIGHDWSDLAHNHICSLLSHTYSVGLFSYWVLAFHMHPLLIFHCLCELQIYIPVCCFFLFLIPFTVKKKSFYLVILSFSLAFIFLVLEKLSLFSESIRMVSCFLVKILLEFWFL